MPWIRSRSPPLKLTAKYQLSESQQQLVQKVIALQQQNLEEIAPLAQQNNHAYLAKKRALREVRGRETRTGSWQARS